MDYDGYQESARMSCILHMMSNKDAATSSEVASQAAADELTESDLPGTGLDETMDRHTMPELKDFHCQQYQQEMKTR